MPTSPSHDAAHRPRAADRARQATVLVSELACLGGTLFGVGIIGRRVEESSGGSLAADATLIAPGRPAFSIWSVIYLGLVAYTIWQLLPRHAAHPRARATGWLAASSMLLNAGWLLVTQFGWLWLSVVVIVALVAVLGVLMQRLQADTPSSVVEAAVLDGTFGLYLGWVCVAVCANITATLVSSGVRPESGLAQAVAVVVLTVAAGVGVGLAARLGGRYSVALAMAWGLGWVAWARLADAPRSAVTGGAAILAAITVLGAAVVVRRRRAVGVSPDSRDPVSSVVPRP